MPSFLLLEISCLFDVLSLLFIGKRENMKGVRLLHLVCKKDIPLFFVIAVREGNRIITFDVVFYI